MTEERQVPGDEWDEERRAFMASLAHDLRTPLAAVYGEADLALRRDRTAETYREVLERIRAGLAEMLDLSADLALLGEEAPGPLEIVSVESLVLAVAQGYPRLTVGAARGPGLVAGEPARLRRALTLVIEHLMKCDPSGDPVTVEKVTDVWSTAPVLRLVFRTGPAGAARRGSFRLRAAEQIIRTCGGVLEAREAPPGVAVEVRFEIPAPAAPDALSHVE
jgi:His Kinase A (phospho-acceptor) domain